MSFMACKLLLGASVAGFTAYQLYQHFFVDHEAEKAAQQMIKALDDPEEDDQVLLDAPVLCTNQIKAINHVRSIIGNVRDTSANRLLVSELVRKTMVEELKMRPSHVARFAPVAEEMYFVPSEAEVFASRIRKSRAVARRREMVERVAPLK